MGHRRVLGSEKKGRMRTQKRRRTRRWGTDARRRGSSRPNGIISDVKEKDDELMMKNGVNSMRMEGKKTIWCHYGVSSPSGFSLCICNMMKDPPTHTIS